MHFKLRLIPAATAAVLLAACGGGGNPSSPPTYTPSGGTAIDGYLQFSKVVCDANDNGLADTGEAVSYTDINGKFAFPQGCKHGVIVTGGTNQDTKLLFTGQLKAPAGATVATPLTTLMAAGLTQTQITSALGLPAGTDLLNTDPAATSGGNLVNPELYKKTLALQQLMQKSTELFTGLTGLTGSVVTEAVYGQVAAEFASALSTGSPLMSSGANAVTNVGVVQNLLLKAAQSAQQVLATGAFGASVTTALDGVDLAAVASVAAPAMQVQAQGLLSSTDYNLVATTTSAQSSTYITDYIKSVKTQLTGTPDSATVSGLGGTLATDVATGNNSIPQPPTSNAFISFDEAAPAFTGMGAYGGALPSVEAAPAGGSGSALKIVKPVNPGTTWGGVYFGTAPIPFAAGKKSITAKVYSSRANAVIKLKVQVTDTDFVEVAGTTTGTANTWGTVTWDFSAVSLSKSYTTMAITPDVDLVTSGQTYWIDDITVANDASAPSASGPTTAAPTPTVAAANVISLFSDAYTNVAGTDFFPAWGQSSVVSDVQVAGNATKLITNLNYEGIALAAPIDVSGMEKLHVDVWSAAAGTLNVGIITSAASNGGAAAETQVPQTLVAGWNSLDIPLTSFTAPNKSKIDQLILVGSGTIYYDNLYFWKATAVAPTDYLYLANNALSFDNGTTTTSYTMAQFQSAAGISVKWPMASNAALKLNLAENGSFSMATGQTLQAAVAISQDTPSGLGEVRAYIDKVNVTKTGSSISLTVPVDANAMVYGVSGDGKTKAVISFANAVRGVTNTLTTAASAVSTVMFGDVVNYAVNGVSNDFTGMYALRGKYKVSLVVTQLPLRQADGSMFPAVTIQVPTQIDNTGAPSGTVPVTGYGLVGYITLTD